MKKLTDEEINKIWNAGMTFKELVQAAYELGYIEHNGLSKAETELLMKERNR